MAGWKEEKKMCIVFVWNGHKRIAKFFTIAKSTPFKQHTHTKNVYDYKWRKKNTHTPWVYVHCKTTKYGIPNELQILILLIGRVLLTEWSNLFAIRLARFNESTSFIQKLNHKHMHTNLHAIGNVLLSPSSPTHFFVCFFFNLLNIFYINWMFFFFKNEEIVRERDRERKSLLENLLCD